MSHLFVGVGGDGMLFGEFSCRLPAQSIKKVHIDRCSAGIAAPPAAFEVKSFRLPF